MKTFIIIMIAIGILFILAGCVSTTEEIAKRTDSTRTDVFVEVPAEGTAPAGFVDWLSRHPSKPASKNDAPESKTIAQGQPGYPFLLNIDGQAVLWTVNGQAETLPLYEKGYTSRDPDAGEGIKYRLEKKIRLAVGMHKIFFGLPKKDYLSAFKVLLSEGESQVLEFKPRYRYDKANLTAFLIFKGGSRAMKLF